MKKKLNKPEFWDNVHAPDALSCWIWTGAKNGGGYGWWCDRSMHSTASREAYRRICGDPGRGLVCHHCDNPPCCNPSHLYLGDYASNHADMRKRGRRRFARGAASGNAKLTDGAVVQIRACHGERQVDIAARFGVGQTAISSVRLGKTWAHVP